jgi:hypothetical protein
MDTRNGVTHQRLSQRWEQAAKPDALVGGMPQEANVQGNAWDMLTWGRHTRRHRDRRGLGIRHTLEWSVVKTGRKSNSDCADAKLWGRVIAPNGVPVTEARVTRSPVMGNYHAGFWSGSGPGDWPTDRSAADVAIEAPLVAGFRLRSFW